VAEVEVELRARKEPVASTLKSAVPAALMKRRKLPTKPVVEEAEIKFPVVEVAFTWNKAFLSGVVVAPITTETVVVGAKKLVLEISKDLPKAAPVSSVSQPNSPPDQVKTLFDWQVTRPAPLKSAVKRLEEEATVLKEFVVVAEVEVEFEAVKFLKVEEPVKRSSSKVTSSVVWTFWFMS